MSEQAPPTHLGTIFALQEALDSVIADNERLKADLAAHREIVEALAGMEPKSSVWSTRQGWLCKFCDEVLEDHDPNCLYVKAKKLAEKEADDG